MSENKPIKSHDHGETRRGTHKPSIVDVSFIAGDYAKDKKATVRMRIVRDTGVVQASVDLLAHQARELSFQLSDFASQVAATEGRR